MANIIIIHGTYGTPDENWFPWLKSELEKHGQKVYVPKFPTPDGQSLEAWLEMFEEYKQYLDEETIVVGHSLGPAFLLSVLEGLDKPIRAAFFVAGFTGLLGNQEFDDLNRTFVDKDFDWPIITANCRGFFVYHADDDPYVPLELGKELAESLAVELKLVSGAGHFNSKSGYDKFELLRDDMLKVLEK